MGFLPGWFDRAALQRCNQKRFTGIKREKKKNKKHNAAALTQSQSRVWTPNVHFNQRTSITISIRNPPYPTSALSSSVAALFFLSSSSRCIEGKTGKSNTLFFRVDRASGGLSHMSTLEPPLLWQTTKIVHCFVFRLRFIFFVLTTS